MSTKKLEIPEWTGSALTQGAFLNYALSVLKVMARHGLRIIGVSVDQDKDSWLNAVDKYQLPWLQLRETLASQGNRTSASEKYGITGVPTFVLIAPDGTVISTDLDRKELKTKLEEIFEVK